MILVEKLVRRLASHHTAIVELRHWHNSHWKLVGFITEEDQFDRRVIKTLPEQMVISGAPPFFEAEALLKELELAYVDLLKVHRFTR